jgi:hypothetical protein
MSASGGIFQGQPYEPVLKRVGVVLIVVGAVDIAAMIFAALHNQSYSSSLSVFAIVAGVFLFRGSLRGASIVRWFAVFLSTAMIGTILCFPFIQPVGLTLTQIKVWPALCTLLLLAGILVLAVGIWTACELSRASILAAQRSAGIKVRSWRLAVLAGVALVVVLIGALTFFLNGETAAHAKQLAAAQLGPGYNYCVRQLNVSMSKGHTAASAVVWAWNDREVRQIPVHWEH